MHIIASLHTSICWTKIEYRTLLKRLIIKTIKAELFTVDESKGSTVSSDNVPGGFLIATNYPGLLQNINPLSVRLMNVISHSSTDNRHD